jgi:hypothetical protein
VSQKPASETPPTTMYKRPPKQPTEPKINIQLYTIAKPKKMSKEETWSNDNYHDSCTEDATFPPKDNLLASSMSHHAMLLDPGPTLGVNDLYWLEFKIAKKVLQVLNKR